METTLREVGRKFGKELRVGDLVDVWWRTGIRFGHPETGTPVARLLHLAPYRGPLKLWDRDGGARIGRFTSCTPRGYIEMTVAPLMRFTTYKVTTPGGR